MKSLALSLTTLFAILFLAACQKAKAPVIEDNPLPSEAPQFSIGTANQSLDTSTQTLCWEECGNGEALANDELRYLDELAAEASTFQISDQQNLAVDIVAEIEPTRFSYTEYERDEDYGSSSTTIQNIEEGVIEVVGDTPKTYIVRAEWYSEDNINLLGSIYTVFTLEY